MARVRMAMNRWDVYRDEEGNPVTLTREQLAAVWHAIRTVNKVRFEEGYPSLWEDGTSVDANLSKSRLLGRMLMDGRPPLDEKPGSYMSARAYHEVEPELDHYYLGAGPFLATVKDGVVTKIHDPRETSA